MSTSTAELLKLLTQSNPGAGTSITIRSGNIIISSGNTGNFESTIEIGGRQYSGADPAAVNDMTQSNREIFWGICSDEAKNSDLYRAYATSLLNKVNMPLNSFNSPELNAMLLNNAQSVHKLLHGFAAFYIHKPETILKNIEPTYLPLFIKHSHSMLELMNGLYAHGYKDIVNTVLGIEVEKLGYFVTNQYNVLQVIKTLGEMGNKDPLNQLMSMKSEFSELLIKNHYNSFKIIEGFAQLGYSDPLGKFLKLPSEQSTLLLKNHYNCFEVMKHLRRLGHSDPFSTFMGLKANQQEYLVGNHYKAFEIINFLEKTRHATPLATFLALDQATITLFANNHYAAIQIMGALYNRGINPIPYLQKLGTKAQITMFNSYYEYVNRINRGVNLELEFLPVVLVNNDYSAPLKAFIANFSQQQANSVRLAELNIDAETLEPFFDAITKKIVDVPVRLDGDLFDLQTLVDLKPSSDGYRINPLSGEQFLLSTLQPAKDVQKAIDTLVKKTADKKMHSSETFAM